MLKADRPRNTVFVSPDIEPAVATELDDGSFVGFLAKMPLNLAKNVGGIMWNVMRSVKWAGGNGIGFKMCALNFSPEESTQLYEGAKAMGIKPFACFTYVPTAPCETAHPTVPCLFLRVLIMFCNQY